MVEEKKKKNKGTIVAIIILVLLVLGFGGYFVYDMFLKTEEPVKVEEPKAEVLEESDFYDVSELVKNNYIEKIETTENDYIKISDGKVLVRPSDFDEKFVEAKGIEGTPKYVYANSLCSDCQNEKGYVVLTEEGNVYYSEPDFSYSEDDFQTINLKKFEKINTEIVENIYKLSDIRGVYDGFAFYETNDGELISVLDNKTFKEIWEYPDLSFRLHTGYVIAFVISPDKRIYDFERNYDEIKYNELLYNGNPIYAKDIFYKDKENSAPLIQENYVIGSDNKIYIIEEVIEGDDDTLKIDLYNEKEVKDYKIVNTDNENKEHKVDITYTDGTTESFEGVYVSTLHFRNR